MFEQEKLLRRFRSYAEIETTSDEHSSASPSAVCEWTLARKLVQELRDIGMADVSLSAYGYVTAALPANGKDAPVFGLIAHMDTSPEACGRDVRVVRHVKYDGGLLRLNEDVAIDPEEFPELLRYVGQDILTSDGTTLLGADDKAGICAIVSACEYLLRHPEQKHGKILVAFTPDEEIGRGTAHFPLETFDAAYAYTVDGGGLGELSWETFNACSAEVEFHGISVHPGEAKHKMRNAAVLAAEWIGALPAGERPEYTEEREGFYHVTAVNGAVESARISMILRDHDAERLEKKKSVLRALTAWMNEKYGADAATLALADSYRNMGEYIRPSYAVVEKAEAAMRRAGVEPRITAVRGGTDGAELSARGLPCPNLFTGGHNFHGRLEYLPLPSLEKCAETLVYLICGED